MDIGRVSAWPKRDERERKRAPRGERIFLIIAQAARWRTPMQHDGPYAHEGVDQGGRWYNGSATRTAFNSTCVNPEHNRNPFSLGGDGQTERRTTRRPTPPWKSPAGSLCSFACLLACLLACLRNKTTAAPLDDTEIVKTPVEIRGHVTLSPDAGYRDILGFFLGSSIDLRLGTWTCSMGDGSLPDVEILCRGSGELYT